MPNREFFLWILVIIVLILELIYKWVLRIKFASNYSLEYGLKEIVKSPSVDYNLCQDFFNYDSDDKEKIGKSLN